MAKESLKFKVPNVRNRRNHPQPDFLPQMQQEIIEVVRKYINISSDQVVVNLDNTDDCSVLELNITLPD